MSFDDELIELQSRVAFQDQAISELSDVVYRQQGEIDRLLLKLEQMQQRVMAMQSSNIAKPEEERPPPHY